VIPIALTIAGSDPSGGAGLQADLKTFHQFGVYGEAVVSLITVQNSVSVRRVEVLDPELVRLQLNAVLTDIRPHAIKTGALGNAGVVEAVADALAAIAFDRPLIVDPVLLSTTGAPLFDAAGRKALVERLFPRAYLLMPNLAEAAILAGFPVTDLESMHQAAKVLRAMGPRNVLIKGGHLTGDAVDLLLTETAHAKPFSARRIEARHTHGTGCTYSAAITAELAKGTGLVEAIRSAKAFISKAIETAPQLGAGRGPLNHFAK